MQVEDGDLARSKEGAVAAGLARAVRTVLERHVPGVDLDALPPELEQLLAHPLRVILRYAVVGEEESRGRVRVLVEAEVDREGIFRRVREAGYPVVRLEARPRVLVHGGETALSETPEAVVAVLEAEGFATRRLTEGVGAPEDAAALAASAREVGCHVAVALETRVGERRRVAGEEALPEETPGEEQGTAWAALPAPDSFELSVEVQGWLIDARSGEVLGQTVAAAREAGADLDGLQAQAAARAGRQVAYRLLADLEQSGWRPGDRLEVFDLRLSGLDGPLLIETIQRSLAAVTEVREVALRELAYRSAVWRVTVSDAGLGWDALLGAAQIPGGRLALETVQEADGLSGVTLVRAVWTSP